MIRKRKAKSSTASGPQAVDAYLAGLPGDQHAALQRLRRQIRAAVPDVEEGIACQLPAFRLHGRWLIDDGAAARHCAIYGEAGKLLPELKGCDESKGTIRFTPDAPLPATLVRKLVKSRVQRIASRPRPSARGAARG
ncbi:MAG TPA: DUF1801 domain-containing protein [Planctomycetota bacterium]|nr:DUF1801 domain-containing protein [Planctomycetota bacterium]